jgi:hypothetical protein
MHLLMLLIRWLLGFLTGGPRAVGSRLAEEVAREFCGPRRRCYLPSDIPCPGWMKVRRLLEEFCGPPDCFLLVAPVFAGRTNREKIQPIRSEAFFSGGKRRSVPPEAYQYPQAPFWAKVDGRL